MAYLFQLGGQIESPLQGEYKSVAGGLGKFISNLITLATVIGGLLVLINFIVAGYDFLTAGGDPKKVSNAWTKIWQSLVGLVIIVAALALISLAETIFGISIRQPVITGPGSI